MWRIRSFIQGIKNLWYYKNVIWRDRWYDYSFMLDIWERKLSNMADSWKDSHYMDSELDEKEIKRALFLLRLMIEDNFDKDEMDDIDNTYGKLEIYENDIYDESKISCIRRKLETPENEEEISKAFRAALDVGLQRKKVTQDEFFEIIKEYEKWWD